MPQKKKVKRNKDICNNCKYINSIGRIHFIYSETSSYIRCDFDEWFYMFPSEFYEKEIPSECPFKLEHIVLAKDGKTNSVKA